MWHGTVGSVLRSECTGVMLCFLLTGMVSMALNALCQTLMTLVRSGDTDAGWWLNIMNACFGLGSAAAPPTASAAFKLLGNSIGAFAIIGLLSIFSGIVILKIPCFVAAETAGSSGSA